MIQALEISYNGKLPNLKFVNVFTFDLKLVIVDIVITNTQIISITLKNYTMDVEMVICVSLNILDFRGCLHWLCIPKLIQESVSVLFE